MCTPPRTSAIEHDSSRRVEEFSQARCETGVARMYSHVRRVLTSFVTSRYRARGRCECGGGWWRGADRVKAAASREVYTEVKVG